MEYARLDAKDWDLHLGEVRRLYIDQRTPVRELIEHFKRHHGLSITENQFKKLFRRQGWARNCTASQWKAISAAVRKRARQGRKSVVTVNGREYDEETLQRELKRERKSKKNEHIPEIGNDWCTIATPAASPCTQRVVDDPTSSTTCWRDSPALHHDTSDSPTNSLVGLGTVDFALVPANRRSLEAGASHGLVTEITSDINLELDTTTDTFCRNENALLWASGSLFSVLLDCLNSADIYAIIRIMEGAEDDRAALFLCDSISARYPTSISPTLHSSSWSLDGLRRIAEMMPSCSYLSFRIRHPIANVHTATTAELLDLAISCVISVPDGYCISRTFEMLLERWFTDPRHRQLLAVLLCKSSSSLRVFAINLMKLCVRTRTAKARQFALWALAAELVNFRHLARWCFDYETELMKIVIRQEVQIHGTALEDMPFTRYFAAEAIKTLQPGILDIIVKAGLSPTPSILESDFPSYYPRCSPQAIGLGMAMIPVSGEPLHQRGSDQDLRDIIKLLVRNGHDATELCWDGFSTLDLCALMGYPDWLDDLRPDNYIDSAVTQIAAAAHLGQFQLIKRNVSEMDMELALLGAVAVGGTSIVKMLLDNGVAPDCPHVAEVAGATSGRHIQKPRLHDHHLSITNKTPLEFAISWESRHTLVPILLRSGASISQFFIDSLRRHGASIGMETRKVLKSELMHSKAVTEYGSALLYIALKWKDDEMVRHIFSFLPNKGDPNSRMTVTEIEGTTPLQYALIRSDFKTFNSLWDLGGGLAPGCSGASEILSACQSRRDTDMKIRFLLNQGIKPHCVQRVQGERTISPLLAFIYSFRGPPPQFLSLLELLLEAGADPNPPSGENGTLESIYGRSPEIARYGAIILSNHGARPRSANILSHLVTTWVFDDDQPDMGLLRLLIQKCQECNLDMQPGVSNALYYAAREGILDAVTLLLEAGGDINYRHPVHGRTPVKAATDAGRFDAVLLMTNVGERISICDIDSSLVTEPEGQWGF